MAQSNVIIINCDNQEIFKNFLYNAKNFAEILYTLVISEFGKIITILPPSNKIEDVNKFFDNYEEVLINEIYQIINNIKVTINKIDKVIRLDLEYKPNMVKSDSMLFFEFKV